MGGVAVWFNASPDREGARGLAIAVVVARLVLVIKVQNLFLFGLVFHKHRTEHFGVVLRDELVDVRPENL